MSLGKVWLRPLSVTETRCTTPTSPATVMGEGYSVAGCGVAQPLGQSVMVMSVGLVYAAAGARRCLGALVTVFVMVLIGLTLPDF